MLLSGADVHACETLETCTAQYSEVAVGGLGITKTEGDLARKVQSYGPEAIPFLIELLEDENQGVRQLAGYTIRDIDGLGPEHLDALIRARQNGDGWIPPAIARIGTIEAIEFLVSDLRNDPSTHTQVTHAFEILGENGAPYVAELYACPDDCNERVFDAASFVLNEIGEDAVAVIPRLLEIAKDHKFALASRQYAIIGIGQIGTRAEAFVPELVALSKNEPLLAAYVDSSLVNIGSSEAVSALLLALPYDAEYVLSDIKGLGENGYEAGPAVVAYLKDLNWDIRVNAADALGHIGYTPAASALADALTDEDDWKLVYAASLALARLSAEDFVAALEHVRETHWYPPVSDMAESALRNIQSGTPLAESEWWQINTVDDSPKSCDAIAEDSLDEPDGTKYYTATDEAKLQQLAYDSAIYSYGAPEGTEPNENGIIEVTDDNMVEFVKQIQQVPDLALKVSDGWLVGADRGEWGGELVHVSADGNSTVLYEGNIEDIFKVGDQLVAISGLAHMFSNNGDLLQINETEPGEFSVVPWKRLPAAPMSSWLIEGGDLLINTYDGGSVIVSKIGTFRMAECVSK